VARFYFHFFDGKSLSVDETGVSLATVEHACLEASATAMEMWPELVAEKISLIDCAFDIADEHGVVLLRFEFNELLDFGRMGAIQPSASLEAICSALADTHRRACKAKAGLDASICDVRKAIGEARSLLDQM
jgi:hypothetical protein